MADITLRPVDFDPFAGQSGALAEANSVGSFVGDKRTLSNAQKLLILKEQLGDPNRNKATEPELLQEIANLERTAPSRGAQIASETRGKRGPIFPVSSEAPKIRLVPVEGDPFAGAPEERGEFSKGLVGGLTGGNPKMFGAAAQGAGTALGIDWLKEQGASLAKAGEETLKGYQPAVGSIANVRTDSVGNALSDFFVKYLPYQTGNALASMAPTIASGLIGAAAGGAAAGPPGAIAGGMAGVVLTGYPLNYGDIYSDALDDKGIQQAVKDGKLTDQDVARITAMAAVPITALDSWSMGRFGSALTGPAKKAIYARIFSEMARGGLREGPTEGLQQIMSEAVQQALGSDKSLADAAISVADNAIGGMAGGGVTGGAAGAVQRPGVQPAPTAEPTPGGPAPVAAPSTAPGAEELAPASALPPPIPAGRDVAAGFHMEPPPGSQIPAVPFTPEDIHLGRAEGATGAEQSRQDALTAQAVAGGIPYEPVLPATEGASPLEQARLDAKILQSGGSLAGVDPDRVRNATLVAVYGENAAVRHAIESPELSAIGDAMLAVAPTVERVRATIKQGQENRDITQDLVNAVDELAVIRAGGQDPAQALAHGVRHDLSYESQQLLQFLDENQGNPQALAGFMERYLEIVEDMGGAPSSVRGRTFDIIQERGAARRQAEIQATAEVKQKAFEAGEATTQRQKRVEEAAARKQQTEERAARHIAIGEAAAGGEAPATAIALAFKQAKPLKGKREKSKVAGAVQGPKTGGTEGGAVESGRAEKAGTVGVPGPVEARNAGNAQPVRERSGEAGAQPEAVTQGRPGEDVSRASQIAAEKKTKEILSAVMVKTRAIDATGKRVVVTERADAALRDVNHQIATMEALLECLG
jgi:hypothetical protein